MTWHVDETTAQRYANRQLDPVGASSVEAHLDRCGSCRTLVGASVDTQFLDRTWAEVIDVVDRPKPTLVETMAIRLGCRESTARILAVAPRTRAAYLLATLASALLAVIAARSSQDGVFLLYLFAAPIGPLAATAAAFGRWGDPIACLHATAPISALRLLLVRTAASVIPAVALTALSIPWVIDRGWVAAAWLLPALALAATAVALSSWVPLERAVLALGALWVALFGALRAWMTLSRIMDAVTGPVQVISVAAMAAAVATTVIRRGSFEYREVS